TLGAGRVLGDGGVGVGDGVEVAELVQAQDAVVPVHGVEARTLLQQQFPADDLVPRGGVAAKFDAADIEGLALLHVHGDVDHTGSGVGLGIGAGHKVDVAVL